MARGSTGLYDPCSLPPAGLRDSALTVRKTELRPGLGIRAGPFKEPLWWDIGPLSAILELQWEVG